MLDKDRQIDANNNVTWLAHVSQGNTRMLLDDNDGYIRESYDYDPYGNTETAGGIDLTSSDYSPTSVDGLGST